MGRPEWVGMHFDQLTGIFEIFLIYSTGSFIPWLMVIHI